MSRALKKMTLRGFKSIERLDDFELHNLTILIGANGAGKSNFVDFFRLLRAMADEGLQKYVAQQGPADGLFFMGPKRTPRIVAHLEFGQDVAQDVYEFEIEPAADGQVFLAAERIRYNNETGHGSLNNIGSGGRESILKHTIDRRPTFPGWDEGRQVSTQIYDTVSDWTVYHFHDTSSLAPMRREQSTRDRNRLRPDASNLAAFLLHLQEQHRSSYTLIRDTVRLIAPFFDDFQLRPETKGGVELVRLEWQQKGSDFPFQASQLSDGTIRFICLATALLQPSPPVTMVVDEPELGLHPYAIGLLASLIRAAVERTQVVISTQSATLLDYFDANDIVVVNRREGTSTFERLSAEALSEWLDEYSVGELWQKNVVQGGPSRE